MKAKKPVKLAKKAVSNTRKPVYHIHVVQREFDGNDLREWADTNTAQSLVEARSTASRILAKHRTRDRLHLFTAPIYLSKKVVEVVV